MTFRVPKICLFLLALSYSRGGSPAHAQEAGAKGDKEHVKSREDRITDLQAKCKKFIDAASNPLSRELVPALHRWWEAQDQVGAVMQGFDAHCPQAKANPTIPNIQAINDDRKALQDATRARDAVKIERRLDLFYRDYSHSTAGNTVEKFTCGKAFELVSDELRASKEGTAAAAAKACSITPPLAKPAPRKQAPR